MRGRWWFTIGSRARELSGDNGRGKYAERKAMHEVTPTPEVAEFQPEAHQTVWSNGADAQMSF